MDRRSFRKRRDSERDHNARILAFKEEEERKLRKQKTQLDQIDLLFLHASPNLFANQLKIDQKSKIEYS